MSLLMKALEKAAKDRGDAGAEPAAPANPPPGAGTKANSELTLEPIPAQPAEPAVQQRTPMAAGRDKKAAPGNSSSATARDSAKAATIVRAGSQPEPGGNFFAYMRDRPLMMFGVLAAVFLVGFGGYVYVQMNPGMFASQPPRPAPIAQAPAPGPAPVSQAGGSAAPGTTAATPPTPVPPTPAPAPLTSLLPPTDQGVNQDKPTPAAAAAAAALKNPVVAALPAAPVTAPPVPAAPRDSIKITTGNVAPTVNPVLSEAYNALAAGKVEPAQRLYNQLLKNDPRNVEALLGLAEIATQQGDRDASAKYYIKVIELDPRNSLAQAGLINIVGSADPQSAETRVKQLIARDTSSAFLYFTLGNTYVDQQRWPDAQQAFFQAHHLQPDNPDYAYNLAIALEHIGQPRSALDFYRTAVLLAAAKGRANFNAAAAQERVSKLEKVVQ